MIIRNLLIRASSFGISLLCILYVKYFSQNPDIVSVNIMLTTLFFSVLRAGFTFEILSGGSADRLDRTNLSLDKLLLIIVVFLYSLYLNVSIAQSFYALLIASILTLIYFRQYEEYTKGQFIPSLMISLVFPLQVVLNLIIFKLAPHISIIGFSSVIVIYQTHNKLVASSRGMSKVEIYYSMILPIGGFSAISIEGIDKTLYMVFSKIIDSIAAIISFVLQGNLNKTRSLVARKGITTTTQAFIIFFFITGAAVYFIKPVEEYLVLCSSLLLNVCWFFYSMFIIISLLRDGELASKYIYQHFICFSFLIVILFLIDMADPELITFSISVAFLFSIFSLKINPSKNYT